MQIRKLELSGFKSFMNAVTLDFGGGITAILGPNGCGKSNVVDAIRWVLGEQSAKQLRGDKMMNVVFGGTRRRKPLSMAEVSVTFSNADGRLAVPYEEVKITRRLSRDGTSDYLLNGAPCRLKDIRDLITDTGAGSHAYSIIEREMVDSVIQGSEDSRRFLLEEASGIMKYRQRRKEALRKLDLTANDLLRLHDIIEEIERQVRSLKRQMGRARRYQEIQAELRTAEMILAQRKLQGYRAEIRRLEDAMQAQRASGLGDDTAADRLRAEIEAMQTGLVEVETEFRAASAAVAELEAALKTEEETLLVLRERRDAAREMRAAAQGEVEVGEQRSTQVQAERESLEARRAALQEELETRETAFQDSRKALGEIEARYEDARNRWLDLKQRTFDFAEDSATRRSELEALQAKMESHRERAQELQQVAREASERAARLAEELAAQTKRAETLDAQRAERREALKTLVRRDEELVAALEAQREERADLRSRLDALRSQHELLESLVQAYEGYGQGAKALLERHAGRGSVRGSLADRLRVPAGLEAAYDVLLHDVVDALVVKDLDAALQLVAELRDQGLGNATLVVPVPEVEATPAALDALRGVPGVVGAAHELLRQGMDPEIGGVLGNLLRNALIVEDAATARRLVRDLRQPGCRLVTRDGVLFTSEGTVRGGSASEKHVSLLGRRERLRELERELTDLETQLERVHKQVAATETALRACRAERRDLELGLRADEETHLQLSVSRASLETAFEECNQVCGTAQRDLAEVEERMELVAKRLPEVSQAAAAASSADDARKHELAEVERAFQELEKQRDAQRNEVAERRVAFVELQGELTSCMRQLERLEELQRELAEGTARRQQDIARAQADLERYAAEIEAARERATAKAAELAAARERRDAVAATLDARRTAIGTEQAKLAEIEKQRREQEGRLHAAEMALAEARLQARNLLERMQEQYGVEEHDLDAVAREPRDEAAPVVDEAHVRELRERLARMGPVNLLALEEYEEKNQRLEFLVSQRDDLEAASESLRATIDKINRTARFLFLETFEQVRAHFRETIRTVFDGGSGDLVLTHPEDPLDSDIEVHVRPRGKKIDTLTQLSSGERALTAIALLFSIYLVKPSPFCVFDEVDAPLDDANILRFVNLLQEFRDRTQFIVITHNKLTMEAADRLYGVTMEEEGVSKLVSVALDGEVKGTPRRLRQRVERAAQVAALLQPAAHVAEDTEAPVAAVSHLDAGNGKRNGGRRRPAARLEAGTEAEARAEAAAEPSEPVAAQALAEPPDTDGPHPD